MDSVSVFFRCDASAVIGTGHVQRCLTLAQALSRYGADCRFITRQDPDDLSSQLIEPFFPCRKLARNLAAEEELAILREILPHSPSTVLVLDSYQIDENYLQQIKKPGISLVVIDDFAKLSFYDCDLILNQNPYAGDLIYHAGKTAAILRGPRFALLRHEFFVRRQGLQRTYPLLAKKLLVTMGGSDPSRGTLKVLRAIHHLDEGLKNLLDITVVLGAAYKYPEEAGTEVSRLRRARLVHHSIRMSDLMAEADLAISAGGSTVYELAALGVPSLILAIADNQRAVGAAWQQRRAAVYLGDMNRVLPQEVGAAIKRLVLDRRLRRQLGQKAFRLVDARGADRAARYILEEVIGR